jgi:predicted small integral membrane protein
MSLHWPDFAWMAWTWQTGVFFAAIAGLLAVMSALAVLRPETPRVGVLRIATTRGDRLFLSLLGTAFICLAWLGLLGAETLPWSLAAALAYAALVFALV